MSGKTPILTQRVQLVQVYTDRGARRLPLSIAATTTVMRPGESRALAPTVAGIRSFHLVRDDGTEVASVSRQLAANLSVAQIARWDAERGVITISLPDMLGWLCNTHWEALIESEEEP